MSAFGYPLNFERHLGDGYTITCRDLPELSTWAGESEDRFEIARRALRQTIEKRLLADRWVPSPSLPLRGETIVVAETVESGAESLPA